MTGRGISSDDETPRNATRVVRARSVNACARSASAHTIGARILLVARGAILLILSIGALLPIFLRSALAASKKHA